MIYAKLTILFPQHYYVLLILTDGQFTDIYDCIGAIVEASDYPMSIIIIGVGNANFEDMERLDADKKALQFNGRKASRDIVQFVPFKKYAGVSLHLFRLLLFTTQISVFISIIVPISCAPVITHRVIQ